MDGGVRKHLVALGSQRGVRWAAPGTETWDVVPRGDLSRHYRHGGQAGDEVGPVRVIPEDGTVLQTPHHHVAEGSRGIEARLARHGISRRAKRDERGNVPD